MLKMHLKQSTFIFSASGTFNKNKEWIKKFKEQEIENIFIKMN